MQSFISNTILSKMPFLIINKLEKDKFLNCLDFLGGINIKFRDDINNILHAINQKCGVNIYIEKEKIKDFNLALEQIRILKERTINHFINEEELEIIAKEYFYISNMFLIIIEDFMFLNKEYLLRNLNMEDEDNSFLTTLKKIYDFLHSKHFQSSKLLFKVDYLLKAIAENNNNLLNETVH